MARLTVAVNFVAVFSAATVASYARWQVGLSVWQAVAVGTAVGLVVVIIGRAATAAAASRRREASR